MFLLKNKKTLKCFLQLWVRHRNRNSADINSVIFSCHLEAGSDDDAMTSGGKPFQIQAAPTRKKFSHLWRRDTLMHGIPGFDFDVEQITVENTGRQRKGKVFG